MTKNEKLELFDLTWYINNNGISSLLNGIVAVYYMLE